MYGTYAATGHRLPPSCGVEAMGGGEGGSLGTMNDWESSVPIVNSAMFPVIHDGDQPTKLPNPSASPRLYIVYQHPQPHAAVNEQYHTFIKLFEN